MWRREPSVPVKFVELTPGRAGSAGDLRSSWCHGFDGQGEARQPAARTGAYTKVALRVAGLPLWRAEPSATATTTVGASARKSLGTCWFPARRCPPCRRRPWPTTRTGTAPGDSLPRPTITCGGRTPFGAERRTPVDLPAPTPDGHGARPAVLMPGAGMHVAAPAG